MLDFLNNILFTYGEENEKIVRVQALLFIAITFFVALLVIKGLKLLTKRYKLKNPDSHGRIDSFVQIQKYVIWFIALLVCFKIFKVDLTSFVVSASAILVVLSFGLQGLFADFISGIIILFDGTIKSNDIIEVGDTIGKVEKITLRNTTLITRDDYTIIMPNRKFIAENVTNWSYNNNIMRFSVKVGVAYGSDTKLVSKLMMNSAESHSLVSKQRKGFVGFKNFGDSALEFELYFWTTEIFRIEIVKSDLRFMIDKAFRENGITIPFPQRDLHIIQPQQNTVFEESTETEKPHIP
ncbi:mechanosensitive ion channel [Flavobacteriales bacterium]|nr:mechanosensitive ion channel [Flavobacteriales bacterium]MDC0015075.1 mechanosensitive ion channel [Flavobacteriales bacterium]